MNCGSLANQIERLQPDARPREVARLCLLLANSVESLDELREPMALFQAWRQTSFRLQAASDQHAAMSSELDALAAANPQALSSMQIATLLRAIKVQGQLLQLYLGPNAHDPPPGGAR